MPLTKPRPAVVAKRGAPQGGQQRRVEGGRWPEEGALGPSLVGEINPLPGNSPFWAPPETLAPSFAQDPGTLHRARPVARWVFMSLSGT